VEIAVGLVIAAGLGFWAYTDAKQLGQRGVRVMNLSPAAWGWLVFLIAIVFGILYLVNRPKAIAAARDRSLALPAAAADEPAAPRRFCPTCGTEIVQHASYCHGCGRPVERAAP
jgi:zinc-ribbon domain